MPHKDVPPANRGFARAMRQGMTPAEMRLWQRLRTRSLGDYRFRRQALLGTYIVDFFCPELKLVIEVDGDQHGHDAGLLRDARRDAWLIGDGHCVLRFTNAEVMREIDVVCDTIFAALTELARGRGASASERTPPQNR